MLQVDVVGKDSLRSIPSLPAALLHMFAQALIKE